ncbi:hypothetical protein [Winogradskya humida]|uniref:Hemin transport protein n=1 Tax=Winogradskya humida TaxID=113566 RepID=A0ABQ3ZX02_9ACTN|nr:hypothetical protein [Actinoplanes humidus]GIE23099.1 hypothetical protein Ahu01nite_062010 [Actinoplanes humidus]
MRRTAEFDAFGPWIDEVHTTAELPRLYRDAGIDPAASRLVLKVPRAIERRDANPDMHLYDFLIAVGTSQLTVLRRRDDWYERARLPFAQITAIEDSVSLLDGRLTVHTADGAATLISYNALDPAPITMLTRLLRKLYLPWRAGIPAPPVASPPPDLGGGDMGLVTAYRQVLATEPGMRLISAARRAAVGRGNRVSRLLRPVTLHASILLADDREIQLLHRRDRLVQGRDKPHSIARTVVPRAGIAGFRVRPHDTHPQVDIVTICSADAALDFPTHAGAETDALLALLSTA